MSGHTCAMPVDGEAVAYDLRCDACVRLRISLVGPMLTLSSGVKPDEREERTTCEACGLEYMGAHRCRARGGADPVEVVNEKLRGVDATMHGRRLLVMVRADGHAHRHSEVLTADECAELSAAFGAIARKLREGGR